MIDSVSFIFLNISLSNPFSTSFSLHVLIIFKAWKLGPALATGCTVVMKSSEKTPITALMVCDELLV